MALVVRAAGLDTATEQAVLRELEAVNRVAAVNPLDRRRLLLVLHMTRALDSGARALLLAKQVPLGNRRSLGAYLTRFKNHNVPHRGRITEQQRDQYQRSIVDRRNLYMHQADAFPTELDVRTVMAEMEACLQLLASL